MPLLRTCKTHLPVRLNDCHIDRPYDLILGIYNTVVYVIVRIFVLSFGNALLCHNFILKKH
jgi:hypothetical protein